jgi:hypothetical protein
MIRKRKMNTIVNITGLTLKCLGASDGNAIRKIKRKKWDKKYKEKNKEKIKIIKKKYRENNKEKIKLQQKRYREKHKEKLKISKKIYRDNNKEKAKIYRENYNLINKEKVKLSKKRYVINNKEKINNYVKNRYQKENNFRLKMLLRHRIYMALKGIAKSKRTKDLLGCTIEELWCHLEKSFKPGMTKENYGKWHVDHIRPCSSFDLSKPEEQAKCFHYNNLQALWSYENISKGSKIVA